MLPKQTFSFLIVEKQKETSNAYSFTCIIPKELKSKFQFISGQYVTLFVTDKNGTQHKRHYSITSSSNAPTISFCVKRVRNGLISNLLCNDYIVGSTLQMSPPMGGFLLDETILATYKNLVFITGGSGVTPIKSMIDYALNSNFNGSIFLIYSNRDANNIIFRHHFTAIQRNCDNCQFIFTIDKAREDWAGEVGQLNTSKIKDLFQRYAIPYQDTCFFTSGPLAIINNVVNHLAANKVKNSNIKFETFFVTLQTQNVSAKNHFIKIKLKGKTQTISIHPKQNILEASLNAGLDIKHHCKMGNCQTCVATLKSGEVYSTVQRQTHSNKIVTCQSYPLNDQVVLDFDQALLPSLISNRNNLLIGGLVFSFFLLLFFTSPSNEQYLAKGHFNTGHEALKCLDCHKSAPGTIRQQLQANAKIFLNLSEQEEEYVHFGSLKVGNNACLNCHTRPNDVHPTHRFMEPRFSEARKQIQPENCTSCHEEHTGKRITIQQVDFCQHCHQDIKINNDPLDISHERLISTAQWNTCLQCHDFHGNHVFEPATSIKDTITLEGVKNYFEGQEDPYSDIKKYIIDLGTLQK